MRRGVFFSALLAVMLFVFVQCRMPLTVSADSKDTEKQLEEAKNRLGQTEQAIGDTQETISALNDTRSELQVHLDGLNSELFSIGEKLDELDEMIRVKEEEIADTQRQLEEAIRIRDEQYAAMKRRVRFLFEKGDRYYFEILAQSQNFSDILNRAEYIERVSAYDRKMLESYISNKETIAAEKELLEEERQQLDELKKEQLAEQNRVGALVSSTRGSISSYSGQIAGAEEVARQLKEQYDQQNDEVSNLEKQLAEERRLEALSRASVWRSIGDVTFAEGDRYLLANLIYCEAGGEPYAGQLAVGAVVMNRVLSGAFPDTVSGVIYQSWQFEPAMTGRLALALARDDATESCYRAADEAMLGMTNVEDCIFFRTPIPQVTPRFVIGGHIFY